MTLFVNKGRVLLAQRAGAVEHVGCWSGIGGFVSLKDGETFAQGAAREIYEETGIRLDPRHYPASPHMAFLSYHQEKHEQTDYCAAVGYFIFEAPANLTERFATTDETSAFCWFDAADVEAMIVDGRIPADFTDLHDALRELFKRIKAGERFMKLPA